VTVGARPALVADAAAVTQLLARVSEESPYLGDYGLRATEDQIRTILGAPPNRLVAWVETAATPGGGEVPVGYAHGLAGPYSTTRHVATVTVAVDSGYRAQGVGARLLERVVSGCRAAGYVRLRAGVWRTNVASMRLFERAGFRLDAVLPEQLRERDGTLVDEAVFGLSLREGG